MVINTGTDAKLYGYSLSTSVASTTAARCRGVCVCLLFPEALCLNHVSTSSHAPAKAEESLFDRPPASDS